MNSNILGEKDGFLIRLAKAEDAAGYFEQNFCPLDQEVVRLTGCKEEFTKDEVVSFFMKSLKDDERYVYELKDNKYIETVFIKRRDGGTVCVSTQVGCPVGCIFCESGRNGFVRNLTSSEIVQQIILLRRKVNRIVFMGMGEPLFNYDNLIKYCAKAAVPYYRMDCGYTV